MSMGDDGMVSSGLMANLFQSLLVQLWSRIEILVIFTDVPENVLEILGFLCQLL